MASKSFFVDTNVLIDDPTAVIVLQNGEENQVYIPWTVIQELDKLKSASKTRHRAQEAIKALATDDKNIHILENLQITQDNSTPDDIILEEVIASTVKDPIVVSNDLMLRIKAKQKGIAAEEYKQLIPFKAESQKYTGFIDKAKNEELVTNCFFWEEGKMHFWNGNESKMVDYENTPWTITPKTPYQNAAMELILNDSIDLVSIQSEAGFGKTFCAIACALELVLKNKKFEKIYIIKPTVSVGDHELGFLPGTLENKIDPYFRNIHDLFIKLHKKRPANKIFKKELDEDSKLSTESINKKILEYMPINFLRGANIENSVTILDEFQQYTRDEARTILSRFGENNKVIITGDVAQIDNPRVNVDNNALNWVVKLCKNAKNYGHIALRGKNSRGPIADLIRNSKL